MMRERDILAEMPPIADGASWNEWFGRLSAHRKNEVARIAERLPRVGPMEGPQRMAFNSTADITGYGGAAGGGKSALICLLALLSHERTVIFRHDSKQLRGLIDDLVEFAGTSTGLNRQQGVFYFGDKPRHMCEWGGLGNPNSEADWRGRPHDLLAADEVTELNPKKLFFLLSWLRTVTPGQRCRAVFTFNPPGSVDDMTGKVPQGRWVVPFFGPWIDEHYDGTEAEPGEVRYFFRDGGGESEEVPTDEPRELRIGNEILPPSKPESRTFIPARAWDNKYLVETGYIQQLMNLEEPLRSQLLLGSFKSGIMDHHSQVLPTKWVDEAMERWTPDGGAGVPMSSIGCDVARGGRAKTVIARRHGWWWDELVRRDGSATPDGPAVAGFCVNHIRDGAPICIDANGVGSSAYDSLRGASARVEAVIPQKRKNLRKLADRIEPYNLRAWLYWLMRMILDPKRNLRPMLPPDDKLRADLTAPTFEVVDAGKTLIESKDDLRDRLGRSTDDGDAVTISVFNALSERGADALMPRAPDMTDSGLWLPDSYAPDLGENRWMLM